MTGGRLRRVLPYVGEEDFCFTYGDGVADVDIGALVAFHREQGTLATVTAVQPPGRFGALDIDGDRVRKLRGEAAWRRRLDERRLLRALPRGRPLSGRRRHRLGAGADARARARRPAGLLPSRRVLAGDGHAARPQRAGGAVGLRRRAVADVGMRRDGISRLSAPAAVDPTFWRGRRVLAHRPHRVQGRVAVAVAAVARRRAHGVLAGRADRPRRSTNWRASARAWTSVDGDIRDRDAVAAAVGAATPEVVIHMAAQSLVRRSFADPRETYETNVMGTVNVLDAVRRARGASSRAVVNVTSDKCYENREWEWGYREDEPMGGHDPYSSSKGCAEIVDGAPSAGRSSPIRTGTRLASARAGNVIGGGDWGEDRLVPDVMRAALAGERA